MIKVTSASSKSDFYLNHKRFESIKIIAPNVHITMDNGNTYIVTNTVEEIQARILNVESATIHTAIIQTDTDKNNYDDDDDEEVVI